MLTRVTIFPGGFDSSAMSQQQPMPTQNVLHNLPPALAGMTHNVLKHAYGSGCSWSLGRPDFFAPHLATIFWTPLSYKIGEPEGKSPIHAFSVPAGGLKFRF